MLSGKKFYVDMTSSVHLGVIRANRKVVQKGVLEATPNSLIFTDDISQTKQLWPLKSLRNIEASSNKVFVIETADPSLDTRVFSFSTPEAKQLQDLVLHHFHVMINSEQPHQLSGTHSAVSSSSISPQTIPIPVDETGPMHWQLNTRLSMDSSSSSSTISPTHSRASSISRDTFEVDRILDDSFKKEHGTLEATENEIVFVECGVGGKRIAWPFKCLRRYGYEGDIFTLEVGRKAPGGEGRHKFKAPRAAELNAAIKTTSVASVGRNTPPSPANAEKIGKVHAQQFSFASPTHRALPPTPPSQPPLPHLPTQATHLLPSKHAPLPPPPSQPFPTPVPIQQHRYSHHSMSPKQMRDIESESQKLSLSSPAFNQSDFLVRRSHSIHDLRHNIFEVRNISDDKKEVGQGTVEVTSTDLIYIDSNTHEKWKWPVRFLRKYGFEENIFSFEAGRRCPGGQGLYAFVSERASEIHGTILESVRDQGKQGSVPARVPLTPQHVRTATPSQSRFSLVDDQALPPIMKPSNKNHYNDNSLNALMKTGLVRQQSPTSNLTTSHVQKTTPNSVEGRVSTLNSSNVIVDPPSTSGKISPNATITPLSQHVKTHGKPHSHHYDTMAFFDKEPSTRDSHNQLAVIGNDINNKKSSLPNLSLEQSRSTASQMKKRNSKSEQKRVSESNADDDDAAILGDVAKDVMHKPRSKVLSRWIGKKSKKKVKRESVGSMIVDQSFDQVDSSDTYVNIKHGVVRSASCDNILGSCSTSDSHFTDTSAVPSPQMLQSQTPPTNRRQYENGYHYPEQKPISVPSSSAVLYQNLKEVVSGVDRSHSDPIQAPMTVLDTPPSHNNDYLHLYSNVSSLVEHNYENQPPPNRTTYAELEIRSMTTPPPSVSPHGSLQLLPHPHSPLLNTSGRLTSTSPLFTKPKPPLKTNQSSDRHRSSCVLPAALAPAESCQSPHIRSQSESSSGKCITSSYEVDGGQIGVASVKNGDHVVYSPLDFVAINAVAKIKRDIRNFDEILKRHDIREMEMDRKKRKNILT